MSSTSQSGSVPGRTPPASPAGLRLTPEVLLVSVLLALSALAWLAVHYVAMPDMRVGILTAPRPAPGMGGMSGGMSVGAGLFLAMWLVMMAAMMLPAVTPVVVRVDRLVRARGARKGTAYAMAAGYVLVWGTTGVVAYGVYLALQAAVPPGDAAVRTGAGVLLCAGVYQLTPLKRACLRQCRSPLATVVRHGEAITRGRAGAVRAGIHHGLYCVGCCWALMVVLVAVGAMSLVWMGIIAALIFIEKVSRRGEAFSLVLGSFLIAAAATLAAAPDLLLPLV